MTNNSKKWNDYQNNYKKTNYVQKNVWLDKEIASRLKEKLAKDGLTFSFLVKDAVNKYLKGDK